MSQVWGGKRGGEMEDGWHWVLRKNQKKRPGRGGESTTKKREREGRRQLPSNFVGEKLRKIEEEPESEERAHNQDQN